MGKKKDESMPIAPRVTLPPAPSHVETVRKGFDTVDMQDVMFERLALMQDLSPLVKDGTYSAGDIVRKSTKEVLYSPGGTPQPFVIAYYFKEFVEFGDRDNPNEPVIIDRTLDRRSKLAESARQWEKKTLSSGRKVRRVTDMHNFVILLDGRPHEPMLISLGRSNAKHGTALLSFANSLGEVPLYAGAYAFLSDSETNRKNQSFYVWSWKFDRSNPYADETMYKAASQLNKLLSEMASTGKLGGIYEDDDREEGEGQIDADNEKEL